jgi:hypothetical protein
LVSVFIYQRLLLGFNSMSPLSGREEAVDHNLG